MWTWLKNKLGIGHKEETIINPVVVIENKDDIVETVVITEQVIETATDEIINKTVAAVDLSNMKKEELLSLAKEKGLKANASMNKQALIALLNG